MDWLQERLRLQPEVLDYPLFNLAGTPGHGRDADRVRRDHRALRAQVGVVYGSDMRQVRQTLEQAAAAASWRVPAKEPVILLLEFEETLDDVV